MKSSVNSKLLSFVALLLCMGSLSHAQPRDTLIIEGVDVDPKCTTIGTVIWRSNSPSPTLQVWGQVGCSGDDLWWTAKAGQVCYRFETLTNRTLPPIVRIFYSKFSDPTVVRLNLDDQVRYFTPQNQGSWNAFSVIKSTFRKPLQNGEHYLTLFTDGLHYGVMDVARIQVIY
jgi:hypothetical protein